jgi:phage terminase large subunit-like protein
LTTVAPSAAWEAYGAGTGAEHFSWWVQTHCIQSVDEFAGRPLVLEPWQLDFFAEALAVDEATRWFWRSVVEVIPRKNGKTASLAAYSLYRCDLDEGKPEILLAASSDEQAGRLFDAQQDFIRQSPYLSGRFHLRDYVGEIARTDGGGEIKRLASNPKRAHGYNPSLVICDELHAWTTPTLRRFWATMKTGGGARSAPQVFAITTAGEATERETGILGQLIDGAMATGEVEQRGPLTIVRHFASRLLVYMYEAPPEADPKPLRQARARYQELARTVGEDAPETRDALAVVEEWRETVGQAAKAANPASWITAEYLADQAEDPEIEPADFLQLHCGIWAAGGGTFIPREVWARGATGLVPEDGSDVAMGIDGSYSHDCTVVAWAAPQSDGRVRVACRIFAAKPDAPHHELHDGKIRYARVEEFILDDVFGRFRVSEAAFDPRFLLRSAEIIEDRLPEAKIAPVEPQSRAMRDALACLHRLAHDGLIDHDGDPMVAAHFAGAVGKQDDRGWVLSKARQTKRIDAVVAIALAVWRAVEAGGQADAWMEVW